MLSSPRAVAIYSWVLGVAWASFAVFCLYNLIAGSTGSATENETQILGVILTGFGVLSLVSGYYKVRFSRQLMRASNEAALRRSKRLSWLPSSRIADTGQLRREGKLQLLLGVLALAAQALIVVWRSFGL